MDMQRICKNCGLPYGKHHGGTSPYPRDYCPDPEGRMDWENGPGTCFELEPSDIKPEVKGYAWHCGECGECIMPWQEHLCDSLRRAKEENERLKRQTQEDGRQSKN